MIGRGQFRRVFMARYQMSPAHILLKDQNKYLQTIGTGSTVKFNVGEQAT
jgi:hypothetical protein